MGTGFSYVNKSDAYARDLATVASDMTVLLKTFFDYHKEFQVSGASETAQRGARGHSAESIRCKYPQELHAWLIAEKTFLFPGIRLWASVSVISKDGFSLKEWPCTQYSTET